MGAHRDAPVWCAGCYEVLRSPAPCPVCAQRAADAAARLAACAARLGIELTPGVVAAAIWMWPFDQAPACLRELSTNGGDEDWVVYVPPGFPDGEDTPLWIESLDSRHTPARFVLPDGAVVFIAAHG